MVNQVQVLLSPNLEHYLQALIIMEAYTGLRTKRPNSLFSTI